MQINNHIITQNLNSTEYRKGSTAQGQEQSQQNTAMPYSYPAVYFCGKIPVKKVVNVAQEKDKLIRHLDKLLKEDSAELDPGDIFLKNLAKTTDFHKRKLKKFFEIERRKLALINDRKLSAQQKHDEAIRIRRDEERLRTSKPPKYQPPKKQEDSKTDFALLNRFKTAAEEDNFNLLGIYREHYSGLNEVSTVDELKEMHPHIEIPRHPGEIIGEKTAKVLPKSFYMKLKELFEGSDGDAPLDYITGHVSEILRACMPEYSPEKYSEIFEKIKDPITDAIIKKYNGLRAKNGFNGIPETIKSKTPLITESDKKLLEVDYDDFVLSVIREQYLGLKKPADIVYDNGATKIKVSDVQKEGYKFPKLSEKVKGFISTGETIKAAQRDYENYAEEDFRKRFMMLADSHLGENEEFLEKILEFDSCRYTEEDIKMAREFLKESDRVLDGEKSTEEALEYIRQNEIRPIGTKKLNDNEQKEYMERLKQEQKAHALLAHEQRIFDESINILYANNMGFLADICLKYRPSKVNGGNHEDAKFITDLITQQVSGKSKKIANKQKLSSTIYRWDTYNEYCNNPEADKELLKRAQKFAMQKDGQINTDKAGQYLTNVETLNAYKDCPDSVPNREILDLIVKQTKDDEKIITSLCKYDDYNCLDEVEKSQIGKIIEILNPKDDVESSILNHIIETEYINTETHNIAQEKMTKIPTVIGPNAKRDIYEHYNYPQCLEFFKLFEDASGKIATERFGAGIKSLWTTDATKKGMYELKILGHDDRLMTTRTDVCYFDKFILNGFHTKKKS